MLILVLADSYAGSLRRMKAWAWPQRSSVSELRSCQCGYGCEEGIRDGPRRDMGLLIAMMAMARQLSTVNTEAERSAATVSPFKQPSLVFPLVRAVSARSLQAWLGDAMAGPPPVSAFYSRRRWSPPVFT